MTQIKRCVLLVDNDLDVLKGVAFLLEGAGYTVFPAQSAALAREILEREIIHVAIVDKALEKEEATDSSGFDFARDLPDYIPRIIYTAFEDKETIRRALGKEVGARHSQHKQEPGAEVQLLEQVNELFRTEVAANFALEIQTTQPLDILARQIQAPTANPLLHSTAEDMQQVLRVLFRDAEIVKVDYLLPVEKAPTFTQSGSVLVKAQPKLSSRGWATPVVVKFGTASEISQEARNYNVIVPFLGGQRRADLRATAYCRQLGGLVYSLIDAENLNHIRVFDDVFHEYSAVRVVALLRAFFSQTYKHIFENMERKAIDLTATYVDSLGLTPDKLQRAIEDLHPDTVEAPQLHFKGLTERLINPLMWLRKRDGFRSLIAVTHVSLCHGDLHGRNILVDENDRFWLIDFARVASSHALRDFAELETDIKFSLLTEVDLSALEPFEHALLMPTIFNDTAPEGSFGHDRLDHAYHVIAGLRVIAADVLDMDGEMSEYYQALLFHTLNVLRLRRMSNEKKEYALLSAALICERLDSWPEWQVRQLRQPPKQPVAEAAPPSEAPTNPGAMAAPAKYNWDRVFLIAGVLLLIGAVAAAVWLSAPAINPAVVGAGVFLMFGAGIIALMWWGMQKFRPNWQAHVATLLYLSVMIIAIFGLLGLVSGTDVVHALRDIVSGIMPQNRAP